MEWRSWAATWGAKVTARRVGRRCGAATNDWGHAAGHRTPYCPRGPAGGRLTQFNRIWVTDSARSKGERVAESETVCGERNAPMRSQGGAKKRAGILVLGPLGI